MTVAEFIAALSVHFNQPRHESEVAEREWLRSLKLSISNFKPETLKEAADVIVSRREIRSFPLPAEIRKACIDIDKRKAKEKIDLDPASKQTEFETKHPEWTKWRIANANLLMRSSPLGREAVQSNWGLQLHDFIRKQNRLPSPHEISRLKADADETDREYRALYVIPDGTSPQMLTTLAACQRFGETIMAKREQLRKMILGDAA